MPVEPEILAVALAVTFAATVVQGSIGIGLGMLSVPVLALLDPVLAPVPQLIVSLPLTVSMMSSEWTAVDWPGVARVSAARIPGIGVGILVLSMASERLVDGLIGASVLLAVSVIASGVSIRRNHTSELIAGAVSGVTGTISSIGGPPLALLYRNDTGPQVRSNLAAIFAVGLGMMLAARAASGHVATSDLVVAGLLAPAVIGGYLASRAVRHRLEGPALRAAILAVCAVAGTVLLAQSAWGA